MVEAAGYTPPPMLWAMWMKWWRRRESNPRPEILPRDFYVRSPELLIRLTVPLQAKLP